MVNNLRSFLVAGTMLIAQTDVLGDEVSHTVEIPKFGLSWYLPGWAAQGWPVVQLPKFDDQGGACTLSKAIIEVQFNALGLNGAVAGATATPVMQSGYAMYHSYGYGDLVIGTYDDKIAKSVQFSLQPYSSHWLVLQWNYNKEHIETSPSVLSSMIGTGTFSKQLHFAFHYGTLFPASVYGGYDYWLYNVSGGVKVTYVYDATLSCSQVGTALVEIDQNLCPSGLPLPDPIIGVGCPGTLNTSPRMCITGSAAPGGSLSIDITNALGGSVAFLVVGSAAGSVPGGLSMGGGCTLSAAPLAALIGPIPLSGSLPGSGKATLSASIPLNSLTASIPLQVLIIDPGSVVGFSLTEAVQLAIG